MLSTHELQNPDRAGELALAVDFGTSVIRAALVDRAAGRAAAKAACRNRLDRYGRDILARIACCGESPEKREEVFAQAALALDDVLSAMEAECGICVRRLPEMVLAANTTHMYLLLRQDPVCICMPPYDIPLHAPGFVDGQASGLPFAGRIYFVPCRACSRRTAGMLHRNRPVRLSGQALISSGVPAATMRPPSVPPPGPISMI